MRRARQKEEKKGKEKSEECKRAKCNELLSPEGISNHNPKTHVDVPINTREFAATRRTADPQSAAPRPTTDDRDCCEFSLSSDSRIKRNAKGIVTHWDCYGWIKLKSVPKQF